jgi:hypothetical protein
MAEPPKEVQQFEAYAWIGRDELGSGVFGLKQGSVPAGIIPMVSPSVRKLDRYWDQAEKQARIYGQKIYMVRLAFVEVMRETEHGN